MNRIALEPAGMEACPTGSDIDSLYRFRTGSYVLYVVVQPRCVLIPDIVALQTLNGWDYHNLSVES